jgi:glycosyltransferase involved in cell wall biosynthesis
MLHGETGYVVPANDPQALAETVRELVDDREKLERMKRQARSYCRHRTFESAFLDHWEMYKACRSSAETVF